MGVAPQNGRSDRQIAHVSDMDTLFWRVEKDPQLRNTMTAVFLLDQSPDHDEVMFRMERASRLVPGWRHRLVSPPLNLSNPRWIVDPDFDLTFHVRWIGAPRGGSFAAVLDYARASTMHGLDRDRPLWSVTVVEGLEGGRAAVIIKLHHVLIDGLGGIGLLPLVVDLQPEPPDLGEMPREPEYRPMSSRELVLDALTSNGEKWWGFTRTAGDTLVRSVPSALRHPLGARAAVERNVRALARLLKPPSRPASPLMTGRRGWSRFVGLTADLGLLKSVSRSHDVSVNDLFLGIVGYGFARYHEELGAPVDGLRTQIAVSTRKPGDSSHGNHVAGGHFMMPVSTEDPLENVAAYRAIVERLRDDVRQPLASGASSVITVIGPLISDYVGTQMKNCDLLLSNIPGIGAPIWFGRAAVESLFGFGPIMGTATNATLVSYNGVAHLGLNIDGSAVTEIDLLTSCVQEGIDLVEASAD
jgi:WS/DGAT/MGAT family acyltransferase